jgi:hypothetical protein
MRSEGNRSGGRVQDRGEGQQHDVHGADMAGHNRGTVSRPTSPAVQPLRDVLTAAIRQRVLLRAAREQRSSTRLVGHICEQCLDAPALLVQPAPWGGEMGVCGTCHQESSEGGEESQPG